MSQPVFQAFFQYDDAFQQRADAATGIAQRVSGRFKMPAIMASLFILAMSLEPGEDETEADVEKAVGDIASDCHRRAKETVGLVSPKGSIAVAQWQNEIAEYHQAYLAVEAEKVRQSWLEVVTARQDHHSEALEQHIETSIAMMKQEIGEDDAPANPPAPPPAAEDDEKPKSGRARKTKPPKETDSPAEPGEAAAE